MSNCDFVKVTPPVSGFQTSSSNPKFGVGLWKGLEDTVRASIRIIFLGQLGGKIIGGGGTETHYAAAGWLAISVVQQGAPK